MSKAIRLGILILAVLVLVSAAVAISALMQKATLQTQNQNLHAQLVKAQNTAADLETKIKKLQDDAADLNTKISQAQQEKTQLQSLYDELKTKSTETQSQLDQANTDRDDWKNRVDTVTRQRDDLMQKLKNRPTIEKIVYKDRPVSEPLLAPGGAPVDLTAAAGGQTPAGGDKYWAEVVKEKATLGLQMQQAKAQLDAAALQVADLKKQNSDLGLQVKQLSDQRDEIAQKLKYGNELADSLSVELAHSRNYQNSVDQRDDHIKEENAQLASQIRDLTATKVALEQSITHLTQEKDKTQRELQNTETRILSHINDVSKIQASTGTMELPPIIINAPNQTATTPPLVFVNPQAASKSALKKQGSIISINNDSNFIISDLGQANSPVTIGSVLKAYRGSEEIATFEVIQVRHDISAADIKLKSTDLRVGDVVELI